MYNKCTVSRWHRVLLNVQFPRLHRAVAVRDKILENKNNSCQAIFVFNQGNLEKKKWEKVREFLNFPKKVDS